MNLCQRLHNPGNVRFAKQPDAVRDDDSGFAAFANAVSGWKALVRQIDLYQRRGLTISEFIAKYAPPSENNTNEYLNFILHGLRADANDRLDFFSRYAIAGMVAAYEGYFV